jgi:uncharacterized delta-60 repeat protein
MRKDRSTYRRSTKESAGSRVPEHLLSYMQRSGRAPPMTRFTLAVFVAVTIVASACGGSGGSGSSSGIAPPPVAVKAGEIDRAFGVNGVASVASSAIGTDSSYGFASSQDVTGRIWSTGAVNPPMDFVTATETLIVRFLPTGVLDSSFNGTGIISRTVSTGTFRSGVFIDASHAGATVVERRAVTCDSPCTYPQDSLGRRITVSGAPEPAYGTGGEALFDILVTDAVPDAGGGMLAFGIAGNRAAARRLDVSGRADAAFATNAAVALDCGGSAQAEVSGVRAARLSTGDVLAAFVVREPFATSAICVVRLHGDGTIDTSYGSQGRLKLVDLHYYYTNLVAVLPRPDGGAVVATFHLVTPLPPSRNPCEPGHGQPGLLWVTADGRADSTRPSTVPQLVELSAAAIQPDGRLLLAGVRNGSCGVDAQNPLLLRMNPQGSPDAGFGATGDGFATLVADGLPLSPQHILAGADGAIYVTGSTPQTAGATSIRLAVMKLGG